MDGKTADIKATATRARVRAIVVGTRHADPAYQVAPVEAVDPQVVGNHFLETMEAIREKNRQVAAARAGINLSRAQAIKTASNLPDGR